MPKYYNLDRVRELAEGDEDFVAALAAAFIEEVPEDAERLKKSVPEHDYQEVQVPCLVNQASLYGTGQLPKFGEDLFSLKAGDVMTHKPRTIEKNMLAAKALALMEKYAITVLVVADNDNNVDFHEQSYTPDGTIFDPKHFSL